MFQASIVIRIIVRTKSRYLVPYNMRAPRKYSDLKSNISNIKNILKEKKKCFGNINLR